MSVLEKDVAAFEEAVRKHFAFLEAEMAFLYAGVKFVDEDPRDSYMVAKYRRDELRIDIAWNPYEKSLGVLIRLDKDELGRRERYLYLEPFVEFTTIGKVCPIVPQIYPGMSIRKIKKAMEGRDQLFANGVDTTLQAVAEKLNHYLPQIIEATPKIVREYQSWYKSRGKAE